MKNKTSIGISILLITFLVCLLLGGGCSPQNTKQTESQPAKQPKLTVVTSFYPLYIMTLNIVQGVPGVEVVNMVKPFTGCLHDYQLTPGDVKTLDKASIFIINGAGMESFMDKVTRQKPALKIIEASKGISLLQNGGEPNPHVWVSISLAIQEVKNIGQQLALLDPTHATQYQQNAALYVGKLENLRQEMHQALDRLSNRNIVTFHEAFPYFAQEFNLNVLAVIEQEPGSEPSPGELAHIIGVIKDSQVKALFVEPQYPSAAAQTIARETDSKIYTLDPAVSGPNDPDAYINTMTANLKTLQGALQ